MTDPVASELRNVLVLTYDFPPCRAPGAAVRTVKFVRYLPDFGWRPTVLCRADRRDAGVGSDGVVTVPPPFPDCPPVTVSHGLLLTAVQAQPTLVKTNTDTVVALAPADTLSGDIE